MRKFTNYTVRFIGVALFISLLFGFAYPTLTNAQANRSLGSSEDNGIRLEINNYSIINDGQDIQLNYTIYTNSNIQISPNRKSLIENPYIWIGHTLVREEAESFKKISNNEYRGTIIAQMHHYRPDRAELSFHTHGIMNQKGQWTVNFPLRSSEY